jgi:hypothetical protein
VNSPLEDLDLVPFVLKKLRKPLLSFAPPLIISLVGLWVNDLHLEPVFRIALSCQLGVKIRNLSHNLLHWTFAGAQDGGMNAAVLSRLV